MTRLNSPSKMTKTKAQPTLLDLFLLKKLRAKKHENIIHDYRIKNINMTKESLIEDWNMMNDDNLSCCLLKLFRDHRLASPGEILKSFFSKPTERLKA